MPCGRSNLSSVFFMPMASTYTSQHVEGQGMSAVSMRSGQFSVETNSKLGSAVAIKGKSLITAPDAPVRLELGFVPRNPQKAR